MEINSENPVKDFGEGIGKGVSDSIIQNGIKGIKFLIEKFKEGKLAFIQERSTIDKAKELVEKFLPIARLKVETGGDSVGREQFAKLCAAVCVDQIIIELWQLRKPEYTTFIISCENEITMDGYSKIEFWESVKEEISKL